MLFPNSCTYQSYGENPPSQRMRVVVVAAAASQPTTPVGYYAQRGRDTQCRRTATRRTVGAVAAVEGEQVREVVGRNVQPGPQPQAPQARPQLRVPDGPRPARVAHLRRGVERAGSGRQISEFGRQKVPAAPGPRRGRADAAAVCACRARDTPADRIAVLPLGDFDCQVCPLAERLRLPRSGLRPFRQRDERRWAAGVAD